MGRRAETGAPREEWVTWRVSADELALLQRCQGANRASYLRQLVQDDAARRGIET